ncbi:MULTISPECIES: peroxide stress protein YaaA [unclassified Helicobacter]|uniref:peroxide stress protein YaaA n=1 Tax=unclassified Helicobacter TaxID=2593540 RepID=UPI000CF059A0|nr:MULTISPECIES: peroxide stress protein YaaA [unclassified Helicobacter]
MKILFSPSEEKKKYFENHQTDENLLREFLIPFEARKEFVSSYLDILQKGSDEEICNLFGVKSLQKYLDDLALCNQLLTAPRIEAIKLYNGVAYKALDFDSLKLSQQDYILQNVFIFSNLFGVVRALERLPFYKFNQAYHNSDLGIKKLYQMMKIALDAFFDSSEEILDLRAEVYIKAYKIKKPHYVVDFLRQNKKVSHYAKYYRGIFLRKLSEYEISSFDTIRGLSFDTLELKDIVEDEMITRLIYEIKD